MDAPTGDPLRIVFFGTPSFAVPTLDHLIASHHQVCGVVTQPDRPRGRGRQVSASPVKQVALDHDIPVLQPERLRDAAFLETLRAWRPDLGVVVAYGRILPEELLALPRLGVVNVHASLLPKYRGAAPIHRAVIDGERETGVTIMRMVKALDAGGMFATATRPIGPDETSDVVERDLADMGGPLLLTVIEQLAAGIARAEPQDDTRSTYAPRLTKEEGLVDWSLPASYIHNRVRGLYPWPHAYTYLDGERLILLRTHVEPAPAGAPPGTIVDVTPELVHVAAGHGQRIALDEVQVEGRRPQPIRAFLAGRPLKAGQRFGAA
jgi:methionyl-tRNA formyltransferase